MGTLINFWKRKKNHALKPPAKAALEIQEEIFNKDLLTRNLDCRDQVVLNTHKVGHIRFTVAYLI